MHQWHVCDACSGADEDCWQCGGSGLVEYDEPDVPDESGGTGVCPKCGRACELRIEDGARWCRACNEAFYTASGWPAQLPHEADED